MVASFQENYYAATSGRKSEEWEEVRGVGGRGEGLKGMSGGGRNMKEEGEGEQNRFWLLSRQLCKQRIKFPLGQLKENQKHKKLESQ